VVGSIAIAKCDRNRAFFLYRVQKRTVHSARAARVRRVAQRAVEGGTSKRERAFPGKRQQRRTCAKRRERDAAQTMRAREHDIGAPQIAQCSERTGAQIFAAHFRAWEARTLEQRDVYPGSGKAYRDR
jgi:hypothetical protein